MNFKGRAKRMDAADFGRAGRLIGVGEDEIRAVVDAETAGAGFDRQGRPKMLFEPHVFWRELGPGPKRDAAARAGLARPQWKRDYPPDSYPRLAEAMKIDANKALRSASWGLGQIMGFNCAKAGYASAEAMVTAFLDDEEAHLNAMVTFIERSGLAASLRAHDWKAFASGYNGAGFAMNGYDQKLAERFAHWRGIRDAVAAEAESVTVTERMMPKPLPAPAVGIAAALAAMVAGIAAWFGSLEAWIRSIIGG